MTCAQEQYASVIFYNATYISNPAEMHISNPPGMAVQLTSRLFITSMADIE